MVLGASGRVVGDVVVAERGRGRAIFEEDAQFVAIDLVTDDRSGGAVHIHTRGKATDGVALAYARATNRGFNPLQNADTRANLAAVRQHIIQQRRRKRRAGLFLVKRYGVVEVLDRIGRDGHIQRLAAEGIGLNTDPVAIALQRVVVDRGGNEHWRVGRIGRLFDLNIER